MKYIYDIICPDGTVAGNSGDEIFDTKEEALADAHDYIISYLAEECDVKPKDFDIEIYEGDEGMTLWELSEQKGERKCIKKTVEMCI